MKQRLDVAAWSAFAVAFICLLGCGYSPAEAATSAGFMFLAVILAGPTAGEILGSSPAAPAAASPESPSPGAPR